MKISEFWPSNVPPSDLGSVGPVVFSMLFLCVRVCICHYVFIILFIIVTIIIIIMMMITMISSSSRMMMVMMMMCVFSFVRSIVPSA